MSQSPALLWYPNDILSSGRVNALSPLEELWYRRALDHCWMSDGMPADPQEFAGWVGRGCTVEAAEKIIARFFHPHKKDPSKVVNNRQEKERKLLQQKRKQKSEAGKRGMASRWKQKSNVDNSVITEDNISIPISTSISKKEIREELETLSASSPPLKPETKRGSRIPEPFLLTSEMRDYGRQKRPDIDLDLETERFVNYWRAAAGRTATKLDWIAAWRTWILGANQHGKNFGAALAKRNDQDVIRESQDFYNNFS